MRARITLVLLLLTVMIGCGDGRDASRQDLIRAADATRDAGGARVSTHGVLVLGIDRAYGFTGKGFRDTRGSTDLRYRYSVEKGEPRDPDGLKFRAIKIGETMYQSQPGEPYGKPWLRIEYGKLGPSPSSLYEGPDPMDPAAIARLVDTGEVRESDRERVRGVSTTHYTAELDLRQFVRLVGSEDLGAARQAYARAIRGAGRGTMRVELWVDDDDLIRRTRQRLTLRAPGEDYPPADETSEFFDFGLNRRVVPPPRRDTEVLDLKRRVR